MKLAFQPISPPRFVMDIAIPLSRDGAKVLRAKLLATDMCGEP